MARKNQQKSSFPLVSAFVAVLLAAVVSQIPDWFYDMQLSGPRASVKPFRTFSDFYPFYLSEHSDLTCRRLHLLGTSLSIITMVLHPMLLQSMLAACCTGYILCSVLSGLSTGFVEFGVMLSVFLVLAYLNKSIKGAAIVMLLGYSFAWVGHFAFEGNRPATFIYPAYSLIGDFRMWFDAVNGTIPGIY